MNNLLEAIELSRSTYYYEIGKTDVGKVADNIINRDFSTEKPLQKWTTDVGIHIPQRLRHVTCTKEGLACLLQHADRTKLLILEHLHHLPLLSAMTAHISVMGLLIEIRHTCYLLLEFVSPDFGQKIEPRLILVFKE